MKKFIILLNSIILACYLLPAQADTMLQPTVAATIGQAKYLNGEFVVSAQKSFPNGQFGFGFYSSDGIRPNNWQLIGGSAVPVCASSAIRCVPQIWADDGRGNWLTVIFDRVAGNKYYLYLSNDAGKTWHATESFTFDSARESMNKYNGLYYLNGKWVLWFGTENADKLYVSKDATAMQWTAVDIPPEPGYPYHGFVAMNLATNARHQPILQAIVTDTDGRGNFISHAYTSQDGSQWTKISQLLIPLLKGGAGSNTACTTTSDAWVCAAQYYTSPTTVYVTRSYNNGLTWSAPTTVTPTLGSSNQPLFIAYNAASRLLQLYTPTANGSLLGSRNDGTNWYYNPLPTVADWKFVLGILSFVGDDSHREPEQKTWVIGSSAGDQPGLWMYFPHERVWIWENIADL